MGLAVNAVMETFAFSSIAFFSCKTKGNTLDNSFIVIILKIGISEVKMETFSNKIRFRKEKER